eukprot:2298266-Amphidinium_carterae.1
MQILTFMILALQKLVYLTRSRVLQVHHSLLGHTQGDKAVCRASKRGACADQKLLGPQACAQGK